MSLCLVEGNTEALGESMMGEDMFDCSSVLSKEGVQDRMDIQCRGARLNGSKTEKMSVMYGPDNRLSWRIVEPMPRVMVHGYLLSLSSPSPSLFPLLSR